ncbi:acyltransferase [Ruminococcus sp. YE282]|uniref:acyltransferase n=1 Tax=Ruminococcus sp. YE282 TaxID=3158780 RepID=UPI0008820EEB|nr:transferase hexapeptide (six repeat-containing protein) [Ruminococcus bromii]
MILLKIYWRTKAAIKKLCFKIMFGKRFSVGKNTTFRKNFGLYLEKGASIKIGTDCFFNRGCSINCLESVEIGDHTIFGENVKIYDQNHKFRDRKKLIREQGYSTSRVKIGNNCWICTNTVILKGVEIGDNSVIGAGCIIYRDIPANSVVKNNGGITVESLE